MRLGDLIVEKNGFLLDIEGVLVDNIEFGKVFMDAKKFFEVIKSKKFVLVTNLARVSSIRVAERLKALGFEVGFDKIVNPTKTAVKQVLYKEFNLPVKAFVISEGGHLEDLAYFRDIYLAYSEPIDVILLGADRGLTYWELNNAFRLFMRGIPLVVLGGELYSEGVYMGDRGLFLTEGAFAKILELVCGRKARYVGKPNTEIFLEALDLIKLDRDEVIMIGDSVKSDVLGAAKAGIDVLLVDRDGSKTAELEKFKEKLLNVNVYVVNRLDLSADIKFFT